jgi:metal-sulfur cluster biosynthetic enzyme
MLSEADILDALRACFTSSNPFGRPLNIVDLGLVGGIDLVLDEDAPGAGIPGVPPRQRLTIGLIPCTADDDANAILLAQIENRMAGVPELSSTVIRLLDDPAWTPARLSPELRTVLKLDPPTFLILNNR